MTEFATIRELAAETGATLRTLRFYEERGLLSPRREGQLRLYSEADRDRLRMIREATKLGFSLCEVQEIIVRGGVKNCPHEQLSAQYKHLEVRLQEIITAKAMICKLMEAQLGPLSGLPPPASP